MYLWLVDVESRLPNTTLILRMQNLTRTLSIPNQTRTLLIAEYLTHTLIMDVVGYLTRTVCICAWKYNNATDPSPSFWSDAVSMSNGRKPAVLTKSVCLLVTGKPSQSGTWSMAVWHSAGQHLACCFGLLLVTHLALLVSPEDVSEKNNIFNTSNWIY